MKNNKNQFKLKQFHYVNENLKTKKQIFFLIST